MRFHVVICEYMYPFGIYLYCLCLNMYYGRVYPKELGCPAQTYAKLIDAIEGMRLSNHIYDKHINVDLVAHGF